MCGVLLCVGWNNLVCVPCSEIFLVVFSLISISPIFVVAVPPRLTKKSSPPTSFTKSFRSQIIYTMPSISDLEHFLQCILSSLSMQSSRTFKTKQEVFDRNKF